MSITTFGCLTLTLLAVAASPGPGVFTTVATALSAGFRAALALIVGIVSGHLVFLLLAIFGLALVARAMGSFFVWIKVLGGLYLMVLGVKIWFAAPAVGSASGSHAVKSSPAGNWLKGLLVTFSNPKAILFYSSIFPAFIGGAEPDIIDLVMLAASVAMVFFLVLSGYAWMAAASGKMFWSKTKGKELNLVAGGVMVTAGAIIVTRR